MRAAEDHGPDGARKPRREPDAQPGLQRGAVGLAAFNELHQLRAGQTDHGAARAHSFGKRRVFGFAQGGLGGEDEDRPSGVAVRRRLESRLDADDGAVRIGPAQSLDGGAGCRVAGDDSGLEGLGLIQRAQVFQRQTADLRRGSGAVGRVGGIAQVDEALGAQAAHEGLQNADPADARIEDRDGSVPSVHAAPPGFFLYSTAFSPEKQAHPVIPNDFIAFFRFFPKKKLQSQKRDGIVIQSDQKHSCNQIWVSSHQI